MPPEGALRTADSAAGPTHSSANATGRPSSSLVRAATGRRLMSGFGLPLGRPRCEARITHPAPAARADSVAGRGARRGREPRVGDDHTPGARVERVSDRRQRFANARVVADDTALERDVEIDADEHA